MASDKSYSNEQRFNALITAWPGLFKDDSLPPVVPSGWNTLGSPSATGYTSDHGRYRYTLNGEVEFDIALHGTSGSGTAGDYTYANTLPAAYRPAFDRTYVLGETGGEGAAATVNILATGAVHIVCGAHSRLGATFTMPLD